MMVSQPSKLSLHGDQVTGEHVAVLYSVDNTSITYFIHGCMTVQWKKVHAYTYVCDYKIPGRGYIGEEVKIVFVGIFLVFFPLHNPLCMLLMCPDL